MFGCKLAGLVKKPGMSERLDGLEREVAEGRRQFKERFDQTDRRIELMVAQILELKVRLGSACGCASRSLDWFDHDKAQAVLGRKLHGLYDLEALLGSTPTTLNALRAAGIRSLCDVAGADPETLERIVASGDAAGARAAAKDLAAQADLIVRNRWDELKRIRTARP